MPPSAIFTTHISTFMLFDMLTVIEQSEVGGCVCVRACVTSIHLGRGRQQWGKASVSAESAVTELNKPDGLGLGRDCNGTHSSWHRETLLMCKLCLLQVWPWMGSNWFPRMSGLMLVKQLQPSETALAETGFSKSGHQVNQKHLLLC